MAYTYVLYSSHDLQRTEVFYMDKAIGAAAAGMAIGAAAAGMAKAAALFVPCFSVVAL